MECDEPIEITPGAGHLEETDHTKPDEGQPSQNGTDTKPMQTVHAEVRLTRASTASREIVCQHVEEYLRTRGSCNIPAFIDSFLEPGRTFFVDNVASITVSDQA